MHAAVPCAVQSSPPLAYAGSASMAMSSTVSRDAGRLHLYITGADGISVHKQRGRGDPEPIVDGWSSSWVSRLEGSVTPGQGPAGYGSLARLGRMVEMNRETGTKKSIGRCRLEVCNGS
jgi:hypothetical protein